LAASDTFLDLIQDGITDLEVAEDIERNLTSKEKEDRKIFHLASSAEKFSKALLSIYGLTVVFPLFVFNKLEDLRDKQDLMMKIGELLKKIILTPFDEDELRRLGHKPISKSELKELMYYTEKLLPEELRKVYSRVIDYMNLDLKERTYEELKSIMDEVDKTFKSFRLKDFFRGLVADMYRTDPTAAIDLIVSFNTIFNDVLKKILYTLYLEHAAGGVTRYRVGRDKADERYLNNIKEHQRQVLEFLEEERIILQGFVEASVFNDGLSNIRKLFEEVPFHKIFGKS